MAPTTEPAMAVGMAAAPSEAPLAEAESPVEEASWVAAATRMP